MDLLLATSWSWPLLVLRLTLGSIFFAHGAQKLFGWWGGLGMRGSVLHFAEDFGIPPAVTVLIALVQGLGGLAVLIGLGARPAAFALAANALGAILTAYGRHGFFMNLTQKPGRRHGIEMHLALLALALAVLVGGGGAFSADWWLTPK